MAHFAELDNNNKVLRVIVIDNKDILDTNGQESEQIGTKFCENLYGGRWVQTSWSGKFRKRFAGVNYTYSEKLDAFIPNQDYPSWILDEEDASWKAPIPYPNDGLMYQWNEESGNWEAITFEVPD